MNEKRLGPNGIKFLWDRVILAIKKITGDVNISTDGTLQSQINNVKDSIPSDYISGGSQTEISSESGGSNVFTFTKADGTTSDFIVKNGVNGTNGKDGINGTNGTNGTSAVWFTGTAVTGTSTSAKTFSVSGSKAGDMYLNTSTYNVYKATAANSWVYVGNIKGKDGTNGTNATTTSVVSTSANGLAPKVTDTNKFLKGDGTWATPTDTNTWRGIQNNLTSDSTTDSLSAAQGKVLKGLVDGKAASSHSHNYAGSSSAGGSATSAVKLDSSAGSATQPVYFSGGKPVACTIGYTQVSGTLSAGSTSITLSSSAITTSSVIEPFTSIFGVNPTAITVSAGKAVLTFPAQTVNMTVMIRVS